MKNKFEGSFKRIKGPIFVLVVLTGIYVCTKLLLTLPESIVGGVGIVFSIAFTMNIAWVVVRVIDILFKKYLLPLTKKSGSDVDDHVAPIIGKVVKVVIWLLAIVIALSNAGYDVNALIAGLGIGGLAIAMASKDTVQNLFGYMKILAEQPFKTGDKIKNGADEGVVIDMRFMSTRIKTSEGDIITIPNGKFVNSSIKNIDVTPNYGVTRNIGLMHDTTPEKIHEAKNILAKIVADDDHLEKTRTILFTEFSDSVMNISFVYQVCEGANMQQVKDQVNFEIVKRFNDANLNFATASMVVYQK